MKCFLTLLLTVLSCSAQLDLSSAAYGALLAAGGGLRLADHPTNYPTLGAYFVAEDVATNNGSICCSTWQSRWVPLTVTRLNTNAYYYNDVGSVPHVVKLNPTGGGGTLFSNANIKVGTPTAGNGFTYLLFGRASSNANSAPLWYKPVDFNEQLRANINFTNELGSFLNTLGLIQAQVGNAFTNSNYKVLCWVYSNANAFAYQNLSSNSAATGLNMTLNNLSQINGNFDITELMVWTNCALNRTQFLCLYSNYFKPKYPNAGL